MNIKTLTELYKMGQMWCKTAEEPFEINCKEDLECLFSSKSTFNLIILRVLTHSVLDGNTVFRVSKSDLNKVSNHLSKNGRLILITDNKYGIHRFSLADIKDGFSEKVWTQMLENVGMKQIHVLYPFPNAEFPQYIYSKERLIKEHEIEQVKPIVLDSNEMLFSEMKEYQNLLCSDMFPKLNNAFMFVCSKSDMEKIPVFIDQISLFSDDTKPVSIQHNDGTTDLIDIETIKSSDKWTNRTIIDSTRNLSELSEFAMRAKRYYAKHYVDTSKDVLQFNRQTKIKSKMMDLFSVFTEICETHQLSYFAIYGTLLGAVRHKGFIPWDNDLDIVMPREDYDKFMMCFANHPVKDIELVDLSKFKNGYRGHYARLVSKKSTAMALNHDWSKGMDEGIHMDILPIDKCYKDPQKTNNKIKRIRKAQHLLRCKLYTYDQIQALYTKNDYDAFHKKSHDYNVDELSKLILDEAISGDCQSDEVGIFVSNRTKDTADLYSVNLFKTYEMERFEANLIRVPSGYDTILRQRYGGWYKDFPPMHERTTHSRYFYDPNVSYERYQHLFFDLFKNDKKIILFGSGYMSLEYLKRHGATYSPEFIVDNDSNKWGKKIGEIQYANRLIAEKKLNDAVESFADTHLLQIESPQELFKLDQGEYKVIITSSYFREISKQLDEMGFEDYYIYVDDVESLIHC